MHSSSELWVGLGRLPLLPASCPALAYSAVKTFAEDCNISRVYFFCVFMWWYFSLFSGNRLWYMKMYPLRQLSIHLLFHLIQFRVVCCWRCSQLTVIQAQITPCHSHTHWHSLTENLEEPISFRCKVLDRGRKPEYLQKNPRIQWENKLFPERPWSPTPT